MELKKVALYGVGAIVVLVFYAKIKQANNTAAAAVAQAQQNNQGQGISTMMYSPSGTGGQVSADASTALADVPATVSNAAPASNGSTFDMGTVISSLTKNALDLQTAKNDATKVLADNSVLATLGITSGSVTHSDTGTTITTKTAAVPSNLLHDFDSWMMNSPVGSVANWANGTIKVNADHTETYTKSNGQQITLTNTTDLAALAKSDADIAQQWRVQYGYNPS